MQESRQRTEKVNTNKNEHLKNKKRSKWQTKLLTNFKLKYQKAL